jgi:oligopeptide/dipeptide ABC transporter ATP-binding protein
MKASVLEVKNLSVHFETPLGRIHALRGVNLQIAPEETLGIAGESGSGKSTLAYAIMNYLSSNGRIAEGKIFFMGENLLDKRRDELRKIWGNRIAMVYQDPKSSLNPTKPIGHQIAEVFQIHQSLSSKDAWNRMLNLLNLVNIPDPSYNASKYPHQLSGGMQQRVVIAMALACGPSLLIMDEPTTGLDVTTQARMIELIEELKKQVRASILYITHDLSVIAQVSDRVGILYAGELVEIGSVEKLFHNPSHPYTIGLLGALPRIELEKRFRPIRGRLPDLTQIPDQCVFCPRCDHAAEICNKQSPELQQVEETHFAKCFRWKEARALKSLGAETGPLRGAQPFGPPILETQSVKKYYSETRYLAKWLGFPAPLVKAVDDVSFHVEKGDVFALVGESGCGKTTLGRVITRLLKPTSGRVLFYRHKPKREEIFLRDEFRRAVQIVFQNPDSSLNPMKRIRSIIERPLKIQGLSGRERAKRAGELLELVKLDQAYLTRYPKQLSGGEKQRVAMARAFAMNPEFIVLDEPVSSLDVSIQASIIALLMELKAAMDLSFLFISHDLSLVRHIASRVGVMYLGRLCELGGVEELFSRPCHPYTRALLSSNPIPDPRASKRPIRLEGSVPSAQNPPQGCRFNTRCPSKQGRICEEKLPEMVAISDGHWVACHIPPDKLISALDLGVTEPQ